MSDLSREEMINIVVVKETWETGEIYNRLANTTEPIYHTARGIANSDTLEEDERLAELEKWAKSSAGPEVPENFDWREVDWEEVASCL